LFSQTLNSPVTLWETTVFPASFVARSGKTRTRSSASAKAGPVECLSAVLSSLNTDEHPAVDQTPSARASGRTDDVERGEAARVAAAADREAIDATLRGDRAAFDLLVERYQSRVFAVCYRTLGQRPAHREDALDLTQEVFVRAYRSLGRFRGDSAFSTWLHRIAVNACLSFRASAAQKRRSQGLEEDLDSNLEDPSPGVDEGLDRSLRATALRAALESLPDKQRMTVILKVFEDRTHAEVAAILGSSVGTVKANLFFAVQNLRKRLLTRT
jgi:RNA polymerase sigma-70 factor (ECF subfamily)